MTANNTRQPSGGSTSVTRATGNAVRRPRANSAAERMLHRLEWQVIRRLDGRIQGAYRTLFYGTGTDFAGLREYLPGDDARRIDWNVTARFDTPYLRQYTEDRDITAWLLLDRSLSMAFGQQDRTKDLVLAELATTIARLLTRSGNRVGAILFDNTSQQVIPPSSGRNQVLRVSRELLRPPSPSQSSTDLGPLLEAGLNNIKRRCVVFLISDFLSEPGWERPIKLLGRRHDFVAVRINDPLEHELPDAGTIVVEDAETGEHLLVDTSDPVFRLRYQEAALGRETVLQQAMHQADVDLYDISTNDDLVPALVRMSKLHAKRTR